MYSQPQVHVPAYTPTVYAQPQVPAVTPTVYAADPGFFTQIPPGSGNYLPDVFGWERGQNYFKKWLKKPITHNNRVKWRTHGQKMGNGFNSASGADPNKYTDKYSNPGSYQGRRKREAEAEPQFIATQFYDPTTGAKAYYPVMPAQQYVQTPVVQTPVVQQQVAYTPTTYAADPMFFNFGRYFNNNIGGKADYGHDAGRRPYPSYGDYYRTHRYPLNDGWMLWDEDLRDLDSKSNKIGLGKDGGR